MTAHSYVRTARCERLHQRIEELGEIGKIEGGGRTRLAASDADRAGRDKLVSWMREDGLNVQVDSIGNILGILGSLDAGKPIMIGSHIDSPVNAGKYDGPYGVIAGLEVARAIREGRVRVERPLVVAAFTNEEGVRFQPDMMGSLVYAGGLDLDTALATVDQDGCTLRDELARIGYAGSMVPGSIVPHRYVELHIEQGPVLEAEGIQIGAVDSLQGISWQQVTIIGKANHAGTTPTRLRLDAGLAAAHVITYLRRLVTEISPTSVATVGRLAIKPNSINIVPSVASFSVDLRDAVEEKLKKLESELDRFLDELSKEHGVTVDKRPLARTEPVVFDQGIAEEIERSCARLGYSVRRMASGAGHDAQMIARICPAAMIFVPSRGGLSHNPAEFTAPEQLDAGLNVLLDVVGSMS